MSGPGYWALRQSGLTPTEKHVLTALAVRANNTTWQCFPGVEMLVSDTGRNRKTVIRATKALEKKGMIRIDRRQRKSNQYTLLPRCLDVPPEGLSSEDLDIPNKVFDVPPVSVRYPTGDPLTISNSKINNSKRNGGVQRTRDRTIGEDLADTSWAQ